MLYRGMRDAQVSKTDLTRRLNWHFPQVDRVLHLNHRSRPDQIDAALRRSARDWTWLASPKQVNPRPTSARGLSAWSGRGATSAAPTTCLRNDTPRALDHPDAWRHKKCWGYPVNLIDAADGNALVTSHDFSELTTFGADRAGALAYAVGALEEAVACRIHARMDVPMSASPSWRAV